MTTARDKQKILFSKNFVKPTLWQIIVDLTKYFWVKNEGKFFHFFNAFNAKFREINVFTNFHDIFSHAVNFWFFHTAMKVKIL